ncbi:MAG: hypothetical protein IOD12_17525 [Silvanigrellales bacterium]|nr:hypothetical protein [Silvanigrellales bacterium]
MGFFSIIDRLSGLAERETNQAADIEKRRRLLTQRFLVLVTFMVIIYNIVYLSLGYFELWVVNCGIVAGCVFSVGLQRRGKSTTAKVLLLLTCSAGLVGLGVFLGSDSIMPMGCVFAALVCPLIFGKQERSAMLFCFLLCLACYFAFSAASWQWSWASTTSLNFRKAVEFSFLLGTSVVVFITLAQLTVIAESLNLQLAEKSEKLALEQKALKDSKDRMEALLAALPDACFRIEYDRNENSVKLKEVRGRVHSTWNKIPTGFDLGVFLSAQAKKVVVTSLEATFEKTQAHSFSLQWQRWNKTFQAEARVAWLRDNEFIAILRDVTSQHHASVAMRSQELKLIHAAKLATLGEMAGNIAHEINNPLTVIVGLTHMAKTRIEESGRDPSGVAPFLERISTTAKRIARITIGLRQMARDGRLDPIEPVRLSEVLDDTLALCEHSLKTRGIALRVDPDIHSCVVMSRTVQLGQVLLNLIGNATDALEGKDVREIVLSAERVQGRVLLRIADSGPRIPEDVLERLFIPFFTTKGIGKGTGLGLSISRGIVDSQGGRLFLDTLQGQTCFCIDLQEATSLPHSLAQSA